MRKNGFPTGGPLCHGTSMPNIRAIPPLRRLRTDASSEIDVFRSRLAEAGAAMGNANIGTIRAAASAFRRTDS